MIDRVEKIAYREAGDEYGGCFDHIFSMKNISYEDLGEGEERLQHPHMLRKLRKSL